MIRALVLAGWALLLLGCAPRGAPVEPLAWWIEDQAQGIPRRIEELVTKDPPSAELLNFLQGHEVDGQARPPLLLQRRHQRQAALREAFARGTVRLAEGEVGPAPDLRGGPLRDAAALADAENADRRQLDALVISLGRMTEDQALRYQAAITSIRTHNDVAAGGKPWTPSP